MSIIYFQKYSSGIACKCTTFLLQLRLQLWPNSMGTTLWEQWNNLHVTLFSRMYIFKPAKVCLVKAMVFPVVMYACESWIIKKLNAKELRQQGDPTSTSWRKSDLNIHWRDWCWSRSSNTLATWCEDWLLRKDPDVGKDWRQEEKWMTEDKVVGWHHRLNGYESEQAPGVGDGQGSLACYSQWGHKTELNWTELTELNWINLYLW